MTREDAVRVYFTCNHTARRTLTRIINWQPEETVLQNAIRMNSSKSIANGLKNKYKLRAKTATRRKSVFEKGKWTFKEVKVWTKESRQRNKGCTVSTAPTPKMFESQPADIST